MLCVCYSVLKSLPPLLLLLLLLLLQATWPCPWAAA
jgi:hypothetical protein